MNKQIKSDLYSQISQAEERDKAIRKNLEALDYGE